MEIVDSLYFWVNEIWKFLNSIEFLIIMIPSIIIIHIVLIFLRDRRYLKPLKQYQGPKTIRLQDLKDLPLVNILIPAWNEGEHFEKSLISCSELNYPKLRVIVNAGGSEETIRIANKFKESKVFLILIQKTGRGKIAALNDCLGYLTEGLVFMVDADVLFTDEILLRMIYPIVNNGEDVVVAGHRPLDYQKDKDLIKYHKFNRYYFFRNKYSLYKGKSIGGSSTVVSYKVIKAVGQFNTNRNWAEDSSRGHDIISKGFKIFRLPNYRAGIYSVIPDTIRSWVKQKIRWNENARIYSFETNLKKTILKVIIVTILGAYLLIYPFLIFVNFGFVSLGIVIFISSFLLKIRRLIFFNKAVEKEFQISVNILFFVKILFYIYVEAFVHLYIAFELLIFRGEKLRKRKNL